MSDSPSRHGPAPTSSRLVVLPGEGHGEARTPTHAQTTEGKPVETSAVLNLAADLIEKRGWTQGGTGFVTEDPWGMGGGPVCLEGGIVAALGLPIRYAVYECPAYNAVAAYLERTPTPPEAPIKDALWQWNDKQGRTASEVIEVLRAAAVIEAAREEQAANHAALVDVLATWADAS